MTTLRQCENTNGRERRGFGSSRTGSRWARGRNTETDGHIILGTKGAFSLGSLHMAGEWHGSRSDELTDREWAAGASSGEALALGRRGAARPSQKTEPSVNGTQPPERAGAAASGTAPLNIAVMRSHKMAHRTAARTVWTFRQRSRFATKSSSKKESRTCFSYQTWGLRSSSLLITDFPGVQIWNVLAVSHVTPKKYHT